MTSRNQPPPETQRWAWARIHAYGFVLAALAILGLTDLINPANTDLARLIGEVPPGQVWWLTGFGVSGGLLILGFLRTDRIAETAGLAVLTAAVAAQTITAWALLGWTDFTWTRLAILAIIGGCTWARVGVLWSRDGLAIAIPARTTRRARR